MKQKSSPSPLCTAPEHFNPSGGIPTLCHTSITIHTPLCPSNLHNSNQCIHYSSYRAMLPAHHHDFFLISMIRFPPRLLILSISSPFSSIATTSSPPPMLTPAISMFGTVFRFVVLPKASCSPLPSSCLSNSTMNGAGVMLYFSKTAFAFFEKGQ